MKRALKLTLATGETRYWTRDQDWHYEVYTAGTLMIEVDGRYKAVFGIGQWASIEEVTPE